MPRRSGEPLKPLAAVRHPCTSACPATGTKRLLVGNGVSFPCGTHRGWPSEAGGLFVRLEAQNREADSAIDPFTPRIWMGLAGSDRTKISYLYQRSWTAQPLR